jgi:fibronectin-binding autotransporter adhesin
MTLRKTGTGRITLSGTNTYSGGTILNQGYITASSNSAVGTGTVTIAGTTSATSFELSPAIALANNFIINATAPGVGFGAIQSTGANSTINGTIQVNASSTNGGHIGGNLTVNGAINAPAGQVVTTRTGVIVLAGGGTYDGLGIVDGNVNLGANNGISTSAIVNIATAGNPVTATLDLKGFNQTIAGLKNTAPTNTATVTNSSVTTSTFTINTATGVSENYTGLITANIALVKSGVGLQKIGGANTYTGTTLISAGTLQIGTAVGVIPDGSAVTITSPGVLDMNTFSETVGSITGTGTVDNVSGGGSPILTTGGDNSTTTFSGLIQNSSGTLGITKLGTGMFTLSNANTYSGLTTANAGTLRAGNGLSLGNSTSGTTINSGATFDINGYNLGTEAFVLNGGTILNNGGSQSQAMQKLTVIANSLIGGTGRWDVRNNGLGSAGITINAGATLTKQDANYCYWANIPIVNNGSLIINNGRVYLENGSVTSGTGTYIVNSGTYLGLISLGAGITLTNNVTVNSGTIISDNSAGGTSIITGNVAINGSLTVDNSVSFAISGIISGTGSFTKISGGILTISGANTYVGTTTISAGTLKLGAAEVIPDASAVIITGTLDMNTFSETVGSITGGGLIDNSGGVSSFTLTSGGNNTSTNFTGVIKNSTGTLSLAKAGSGTLTLSGTNTYAGITDILAGTIKVNNTLALGSNGNGTIVYSGATLDLNGFNYTTAEP